MSLELLQVPEEDGLSEAILQLREVGFAVFDLPLRKCHLDIGGFRRQVQPEKGDYCNASSQ